jgi:hypothetical protein
MGAAPDESKVHQNYIRTRYRVEYRFYIHDIGYNVGFTDVKTCSWHYDIGYDIVANYDIVYDIVPDVTKIHSLALRCDFFSRYLTGYRGFCSFNIGIYRHRIGYRIRF